MDPTSLLHDSDLAHRARRHDRPARIDHDYAGVARQFPEASPDRALDSADLALRLSHRRRRLPDVLSTLPAGLSNRDARRRDGTALNGELRSAPARASGGGARDRLAD